jgi:homoserine O-acetyltransferase
VSTSVTLPADAGLVHLPLELPLELGGRLEGAHLAFEAHGPEDAPLVLVLGGISAGRHVAASPGDPSPGWWEALVGEGRAIDTRCVRAVGIDWLGGAGASTGPAASGLGADFPVLRTGDQARALASLLDHLGVGRARAIVGASFGGMVGLAFAQLFPDRVERLVAIAAAHASHPLASAWRSVQRRILALGVETGLERRAVAIARSLAMATYRGRGELAERFGGPAEGTRLPVEDYLEARGEAFAGAFDAHAYRCLSLAIDLHRVEPERIATPATLVAFDSDQIVPPEQVRELAARLAGPVELHEIRSVHGHDGFLKEPAALAPILRGALGAREVRP